MRDKNVRFDRKKHILYSRHREKLIRERLILDYGEARVQELWRQTQLQHANHYARVSWAASMLVWRQGSQRSRVRYCVHPKTLFACGADLIGKNMGHPSMATLHPQSMVSRFEELLNG